MQQERDIVFFDLEATGIDPLNDRIVEISMVKIHPDQTREVRTRRFNPTIPIPPEASAVHGIYDDDVSQEPLFSQVAANLARWLEDCDLGGYNLISYDIPLLCKEFERADVPFSMEGRRIIDSYVIFKKMVPHDLSEAYYFYTGNDLENAHSAEADILATVAVWESQKERYFDQPFTHPVKGVSTVPNTLDGVHEFCVAKPKDFVDAHGRFRWLGTKVQIGFGRKRGMLLEKIAVEEPSFLQWVIRSEFEEDVKNICRDALKGVFPTKE